MAVIAVSNIFLSCELLRALKTSLQIRNAAAKQLSGVLPRRRGTSARSLITIEFKWKGRGERGGRTGGESVFGGGKGTEAL